MSNPSHQFQSIDWFKELRSSHSWLSRVLHARIRNQHAVEDVLQELATAAPSWPESLNGTEAIRRWLYSVAVKQAAIHWRTKSRNENKLEQLGKQTSEVSHSENCPLESLIASENVELVQTALTQLSDRQREVLMLKYYENWSCRQISERCGLEESTVKRHLVNARQNLRSRLQQLENDHEQ